jgi:PAP2 superfamily
MSKSTILRLFLLVTAMQFFITSCKKDDPTQALAGAVSTYDSTVPLAWNKAYLEVERFTPGYRPPISARTLGYVGLAAYESTVSGMTDYQSLAKNYPGLTLPAIEKGKQYQWPVVLNACYANSLRLHFPTAPAKQAKLIDDLEDLFNKGLIQRLPLDVFNRSKEYGKKVAEAVYAFSKTDAVGHAAYLNPTDKNYPDGTKLGEWARTFPDFGNPLLPNWGNCRTMCISKADMKIIAPVAYSEVSTSEFYKQGKEVQTTVDNIKAGKYNEGRWIADFWSDDCAGLTMTPAGRWISVANQVVESKKPDLEKAVLTYAKIGLSLCDAGIACWDQKFFWKVERPQSYVRRVLGSKDWTSIMCPSGEDVGKTPPFPAYPSGHSTFGAAAAEILTTIYGDNYAMADFSHLGRTEFIGKPRFFKSFYAMADENAYSRIPIGVHYRMDCKEGLELGYRVAKKVNAMAWKK